MTPVFVAVVVVYVILPYLLSADNIALNKSAYQIGKWGGGVAERAVDGQYDVDYGTQDYYLTVCARPDTAWRGHVPAVWWVDLEDVYNISTITVYNTYDMEGYQKLSNFTVDVVKSDNRTRQRCGVYNGSEPVSRGGSFTFNCDNLSGRYVYVRKLAGKDQTNIPLCEVEVYGVLAKGSTKASQTTSTTTETITSSPTISQNKRILGPLIDIPLWNKPTNQTGAFGGLTSDKAVDGLLYNTGGDDDDNAHCAYPLNQEGQPAEWWIDLEEMYKIHSITLYNTGNAGGDFRMADFAIRVYNPRVQSYVTCAEYPERVGPAANITLTCGHNVYGEYVQFIRLGGREINKVTICEVEIKGQKYSGCPLGYYGDQCNQLCGMCSNEDPDIYNPCDVTGSCINGCQMWWITEICKTEIVKPHYDGQQISLNMSTSDQIDIYLQQVDVPSNISQYYGYNITYDNDESLLVNHDHGKTTIIVSLTGLSYNTEYSVKVQPYRVMTGRYDYGSTYPEKAFKTKCAAPDPPTFSPNPRNSSLDADRFEITVNYEVPKEIRCDSLTRLQVSYHSDGNSTWTSVDADLNLDTLSIASLDPGTYFIKMTATNNEGLWAESETKSVAIGDKQNHLVSKKTAIIVSTVAIIVLIIIAVITAVILLKRRYMIKCILVKVNEEPGLTEGTANTSPVEASDSDAIRETTKQPAPQSINGNSSGICDTNAEVLYVNAVISLSEFEDYVKGKKQSMKNVFDEFKKLPSPDYTKSKAAVMSENIKKNRFQNIYPYDENRVTLVEAGSNIDNDYINASFIKGYGNTEKAYIAAQGVKSETVKDFWKMIWKYHVNRIVMLANLVEGNKMICDQYWPSVTGRSVKYGEYSVTFESEAGYAYYKVRSFRVSDGVDSRPINHFHFTSWSGNSEPLYGPSTLLSFHRKVHSLDIGKTGPLLVHCGTGVGRTGTFIAIDILLQQMVHVRGVDIYGCVKYLREQRMLMVQTVEQYMFLHVAILEASLIGDVAYACSRLEEQLKNIYEQKENGESELERQFMLLCKLKNTEDNQKEGGLLEENLRISDGDRPYLMTQAGGSNHNINAIYVDSFRKHKYFIIAQTPLTNKQTDFWRLVYDYQVKCIVMLNDLEESGKSCNKYWVDEGTVVHEPLKVQHVSAFKLSEDIIIRQFVVYLAEGETEESSSKPLSVRHYQLLNWSNKDTLPSHNGAFLSLIEEIHRWQEMQESQDPSENDKMIIHCFDGDTASGLFCGASHVIEQIKMNNEVDAFVAARLVSMRRKSFFDSQEEYRFLFDIALEYVSKYSDYVNVS